LTRPSGQARPPAAFAALRGEVGSEQEMSFNRLVFALAIFAYLFTAGRSVAAQSLPDLALWGALALGVFLHIKLRPRRNVPRRVFALLLDMGFLS
jgi:two-component system, sensor histidine kinase RpfC